MMASLIDAAEKAAAACDDVQTIVVGLRASGFVVMGRIATPLLGYSHELSVSYATADIEPAALPFAVERMERILEERRGKMGQYVAGNYAKHVAPVRIIERSDWSFWDQAVRALAVMAILACVPLAGGLFV